MRGSWLWSIFSSAAGADSRIAEDKKAARPSQTPMKSHDRRRPAFSLPIITDDKRDTGCCQAETKCLPARESIPAPFFEQFIESLVRAEAAKETRFLSQG
jgi:hypothetical protein